MTGKSFLTALSFPWTFPVVEVGVIADLLRGDAALFGGVFEATVLSLGALARREPRFPVGFDSIPADPGVPGFAALLGHSSVLPPVQAVTTIAPVS